MALAALWRLAGWMRSDWRVLGPLLAMNVLGMGFGWWYYVQVGQFVPGDLDCGSGAGSACEHVAWWPLVSDSPNALLLFAVAILVPRLGGRRRPWLDSVAFVLNVYVGLWTTFLFLAYADRMGTFEWGSTNNVLFFTHMGMPLQALLLVPALRRDAWRWRSAVLFLAALAAYVAVDYWGPMLHPAPFLHPRDGLLHLVSPWLMVAAACMWLLLAAPWDKAHAREPAKA